MTVFGGIAEFERSLILSRVQEGREVAMARGVAVGRPSKLRGDQKDAVRDLVNLTWARIHQQRIRRARSRAPVERLAGSRHAQCGAIKAGSGRPRADHGCRWSIGHKIPLNDHKSIKSILFRFRGCISSVLPYISLYRRYEHNVRIISMKGSLHE